MADVKITLHSNRQAALREIGNACKAALERCGAKAESYAKEICPVDTGLLKSSITHRPVGSNEEHIGTPVNYAPFVELGHHQEPGRYVPAIGKRLVADFVQGKPYIGPSLENHVSEYRDIIIDELRKI